MRGIDRKFDRDYWLDRALYAYTLYSMTLHGGNVPWHMALFSRLTTPLLGDYVLETTTFYSAISKNEELVGVGLLLDRVFDINLEKQPPVQNWKSYLWQLSVCTRKSTEPRFNWSNASFIVLADWDWLDSFRKMSEGGMVFDRNLNFDCCNKATWWWLEKAEQQKQQIMARAAVELSEQKQNANKMRE